MELAEWKDFFVATAGAAAGLAGLIIVAMSVNIETIVAEKSLPSRAATTIAGLILVVVAAVAGLIPNLSHVGYGTVLIVGSLAAWYIATESGVRIVRAGGSPSVFAAVAKSAVGVLPALLVVIAGVLVLVDVASGLDLLAAGILLAFIGSVLNAWVLLVEIRR